MKKIISLLQNIGFTQYESQAYLALVQQSNVTGYELAKNSGIPASKIYQILNKLIDKDVILPIDSEPKKYVPVSPDEILSRLKGDYMHTLDQLSDKLNKVYTEEQLSDNYIWNIADRETILRKVNEFIGQSSKQLYLSVWDEEVDEISESLKLAAKNGVRISIVHFGKKYFGIGKEFPHGREHHIRLERGGRRITLIVDDKKVIVGHFLEDGSCNAVWTANSGLVMLAKDYIVHDIYTIRIHKKYGDEAMELFEKV